MKCIAYIAYACEIQLHTPQSIAMKTAGQHPQITIEGGRIVCSNVPFLWAGKWLTNELVNVGPSKLEYDSRSFTWEISEPGIETWRAGTRGFIFTDSGLPTNPGRLEIEITDEQFGLEIADWVSESLGRLRAEQAATTDALNDMVDQGGHELAPVDPGHFKVAMEALRGRLATAPAA